MTILPGMSHRIIIDQSNKEALVVGTLVPLRNTAMVVVYSRMSLQEILYRNQHPNGNGEVIRRLRTVALVNSYLCSISGPGPIFRPKIHCVRECHVSRQRIDLHFVLWFVKDVFFQGDKMSENSITMHSDKQCNFLAFLLVRFTFLISAIGDDSFQLLKCFVQR